jgi:plasmid stabilization system protein ParE
VSKPVFTTPEADLQIMEMDAWWRANRDKAPNLFEEELALAFEMIGAAPGVGKRYPHPGAAVRRVLMRSTRNHVYYVEWDDRVVVVAVWGAVKGSGPDLADL